jgi:hypothetical protein
MLTITSADPDNPANIDTKEINLRQKAYNTWDGSPVGTVFFFDDFDYIINNWPAANPKYGWPLISGNDGLTPDNQVNITTSAAMANVRTELENKGWTYANAFARAEGWIYLGASSAQGLMTTGAITEIEAGKVANLLVSFYASRHATGAGVPDVNNTLSVSAIGDGTINDTGEKSATIELLNSFGFDKYYFVVRNATRSTQIRISASQAATNRFHLDNVKVERADNNNPVAPATESVTLPLDYAVTNRTTASAYVGGNIEGNVVDAGATLTYAIRVNRAWTATPSETWLNFTQVRAGAVGNGSNSGGVVIDGVGTATATALSYYDCRIAVDANDTGAPRTATIVIASDDQTVRTISITQAAGE